MTCKLCLQQKKCVEAHIIPESLFRIIKQGGKAILILSPNDFHQKHILASMIKT